VARGDRLDADSRADGDPGTEASRGSDRCRTDGSTPVTAQVIEVGVVVKWTGDGSDGRAQGDHPLFTPHRHIQPEALPEQGMGRAASRSKQPPPPTLTERTILMRPVGADGLPVSVPASTPETPAAPDPQGVEDTVVLQQLPGESRPALQGWSDIDEHLHRVDRSLAPLAGGWWWSCCDKTVIRSRPRDLEQVPVEQLCPRCWDVPTLLAERDERQCQAAQAASSER
jgi:hypothetical protein